MTRRTGKRGPGLDDATRLTTLGRSPEVNYGIVNPPVYRASTVLFPTVEALEKAQAERFHQVYYGRYGTPTTFALEEAVAALEGGARAIALASGKAAILAALLAFVAKGDHALIADSVYGPTRRLAVGLLARFGVETTFYDPLIGEGIAGLVRPRTRLVFVESPGSLTFEVQDVPAIARAAHAAGAVVVMDNTWATPLFFKPFAHGVDVSIQSATKYIVGHADAMLGVLTTTATHYKRVRLAAEDLGAPPGPDDCYLALRGLRTLGVRLTRHQQAALRIARWLAQRAEVARILHPAFPGHPGHDVWARDFLGSTGLFGVLLKPYPKRAVAAMLDRLELFGMGYSWGGYESLAIPADPRPLRTAVPWRARGALLRLHIGLEDPDDLIADLERGLARLRRATGGG